MALCVFGSLAWLIHRSPQYQATATILVSPIPAVDESFVGLPLLRGNEQEPDRVTGTAAALIRSPRTAVLAAHALHESDPGVVASAIAIKPRSKTSIVEINATAGSPARSALLANAYANAALRARGDLLRAQAKRLIANTERSLATAPPGTVADTFRTRIANLRSVLRRGDPTLSLAGSAVPGTAQAAGKAKVLLIALLAGLGLAGLTIILIELLAPRPIEDESELSAAYPLPILSRVPAAALADDLRRPLAEAPQLVREGFRALRGQLELRAADQARSDGERASVVLLVSPGPADGRPACSLNLARAFISAQESVTVVELDLRNPRMAGLLGTDPRHDIGDVLDGATVEWVADHPDGSGQLRLIAAPPAIDLTTLEQVVARSAEIVDDSRRLSDWIVVDAPPIAEAADALVAASAADYIVVVVRLGATSPDALAYLREMFEQADQVPDGLLVVGDQAGAPRTEPRLRLRGSAKSLRSDR